MEEKDVGVDVGQDPEAVRRYTAAVRRATHLPVLAKMTPNLADMRPAARAAIEAGANGIAAINTLKSITNVNLDTYVTAPSVRGRSSVGGYSGAAVKPIALRFMADLGADPALKDAHLSGMGGIETWRDAVEFLLLGAGSLQITTAVMQYGYRIIDDLLSGFLDVFHEICHRIPHSSWIIKWFKVRSAEAFVEINALVGYLSLMGVKVVIFYLYEFTGHCPVGNIKNTMKVEALLFGRTFPYADVFPSFTL
jgi:hypothetical protein